MIQTWYRRDTDVIQKWYRRDTEVISLLDLPLLHSDGTSGVVWSTGEPRPGWEGKGDAGYQHLYAFCCVCGHIEPQTWTKCQEQPAKTDTTVTQDQPIMSNRINLKVIHNITRQPHSLKPATFRSLSEHSRLTSTGDEVNSQRFFTYYNFSNREPISVLCLIDT